MSQKVSEERKQLSPIHFQVVALTTLRGLAVSVMIHSVRHQVQGLLNKTHGCTKFNQLRQREFSQDLNNVSDFFIFLLS